MKTFYYRHNKFNEKPHDVTYGKISFNEITFVLKGGFKYEVNGEVINLKENDCIYLCPGSFRKRPAVKACDYVSFNFDGKMPQKLPTHFPDCVTGEIKLLINLCDDLFNKYLDWSDKIDSALDLIVKLLYDKLSTNEENPIIIKIKRYVANNLDKKLTLSKICKTVGYSPNYCDTLFKNQTGVSIVDYLINARIEKAKLLINENILSLKEIAEAVGFDDYNYFSRTFKMRSGYPPKPYKTIVVPT